MEGPGQHSDQGGGAQAGACPQWPRRRGALSQGARRRRVGHFGGRARTHQGDGARVGQEGNPLPCKGRGEEQLVECRAVSLASSLGREARAGEKEGQGAADGLGGTPLGRAALYQAAVRLKPDRDCRDVV